MKKLILILCLTASFFSSCSSDDNSNNNDDSTVQEDLFVGIWNLSRSTDEDGSEREIDDCNGQSNFTINSDGTFTETVYSSATGEPCELDFADPGTWENLGNNVYRITYDPDEDGDTYTEDVTVSNNTFSVFYDDPFIYSYSKN